MVSGSCPPACFSPDHVSIASFQKDLRELTEPFQSPQELEAVIVSTLQVRKLRQRERKGLARDYEAGTWRGQTPKPGRSGGMSVACTTGLPLCGCLIGSLLYYAFT